MYVEHPYKFNDKFYAKVDGKFYEITREVAKAMLSAYRNEIYRSKKWQPEDPETMTRKTKWTELLDCVFSENTDGIGVQDLPDEGQRSVAEELIAWKAQQEEIKDILQEEYQDYGLILATEYGLPRGGAYIRDSLNKLIKQHDLPQIVFHSFRHMSVTYKLKLNGGDIKAVQGDSGHAQADMVTEVYSHIIDEDRRRNATLLEDSFYNRKNLNPQIHDTEKRTMMEVPEGVDAELLAKVLSNPEMAVLLTLLAKSMQGEHN